MTLFFKVSYLGLSSLQTIGIKISGKEYGQIIGSMLQCPDLVGRPERNH